MTRKKLKIYSSVGLGRVWVVVERDEKPPRRYYPKKSIECIHRLIWGREPSYVSVEEDGIALYYDFQEATS